MNIRKIYSKNADYQKFEVLKTNRNKRYRYREFFVEGVRNINEAIKNNWQISSLLYAADKPLSNWARDILKTVKTDVNFELEASLMDELSGKGDTSELIAVMKMREDNISQLKLSANPILVLFDRPSNKGNLGTIIRSCDALGVEGLIITGHAVDPYDPDTIVSSMGSIFKVPVLKMADNATVDAFIAQMKAQYGAFKTVGTTAHCQTSIYDIDMKTPILLFIGNETDGLCTHFMESCDVLGTIPMDINSSATSFNVACAATVLFYEAVRQRKQLNLL
jgi:23S rRNA (uridine2479-2'-O)-methyltransferase